MKRQARLGAVLQLPGSKMAMSPNLIGVHFFSSPNTSYICTWAWMITGQQIGDLHVTASTLSCEQPKPIMHLEHNAEDDSLSIQWHETAWHYLVNLFQKRKLDEMDVCYYLELSGGDALPKEILWTYLITCRVKNCPSELQGHGIDLSLASSLNNTLKTQSNVRFMSHF